MRSWRAKREGGVRVREGEERLNEGRQGRDMRGKGEGEGRDGGK